MQKIFILLAVLGLLFVGIVSPIARPAIGGTDDVCPDENLSQGTNLGWHKDEGTSPSYTAPSGYIVDQICVKGGENKKFFSNNNSDGCWDPNGIGSQSASVIKVGSGSSCKDISHASFHISLINTSTPTPTPTVTPTSTPTPTPTPGDEEEPTPTPTDTENRVTPTPTESEDQKVDNTPTPTPTQTPSSSTNSGGTGGGDIKVESKILEKQGEVLGASTIAPTGTFASTIATIEGVLGSALVAAGIILNGKKSKKTKKGK